jgi:prepilin-type N-terminal cleavage/methylation domain-containing protein
MSTTKRVTAGPQAGFTLVEALIAMVVLSFGLIAVTNLMLVAATSNSVANQSSAATSIASQQLELLKACTFTDQRLAAGGDLQNDAANFNSDTDVPGVGRIHTRWQITDVDGTTKYIVVRSEGTGALAGPRSRAQFTTLRVQQPTS